MCINTDELKSAEEKMKAFITLRKILPQGRPIQKSYLTNLVGDIRTVPMLIDQYQRAKKVFPENHVEELYGKPMRLALRANDLDDLTLEVASQAAECIWVLLN